MHRSHEAGQTLVALLIFMMLLITMTTVAATITIINARSNSALASGEQAYLYAESGIENALLRLHDDVDYPGGTVSFTNGAATISVTGTTDKTIVSEGTSAGQHRSVTVTVSNVDTNLTVTSWSETP